MCGGVVAEQLDAEAPDAVAGDIDGKQSPVAEPEPSVNVEQCDENQNVPNQFVQKRRLHDERHLPSRDAVERMWVDESRGVPAVEDLQAPRQRRFPAVKLLVEVVPETTDGLRQDQPRSNRVGECRQRNSVSPAADPGSDATEGYSAPDAQSAVPDPQCRAETRTARAPIGPPVGGQVIEPAANQPKRHRPQRDVVDHPGLAAAGRPAPVADQQRGHDADDDEQRVGTNRQRPDVPDTLRRAGDISGRHRHDTDTLWRTPVASSSASARNAGRPSLSADTNAEPTMTPSA